jgi:hypothetical protein
MADRGAAAIGPLLGVRQVNPRSADQLPRKGIAYTAPGVLPLIGPSATRILALWAMWQPTFGDRLHSEV